MISGDRDAGDRRSDLRADVGRFFGILDLFPGQQLVQPVFVADQYHGVRQVHAFQRLVFRRDRQLVVLQEDFLHFTVFDHLLEPVVGDLPGTRASHGVSEKGEHGNTDQKAEHDRP